MLKIFSLRKSKKVLISVYHLLRRKRKKLLPAQINEIQHDLKSLQDEVLAKNKEGASYLAHKVSDYGAGILRKGRWEKIRDIVLAIAFALAVALVIRQVWFELYQIPSGSMRPTLREEDRLIVSKTSFGVNVPFSAKHFYFDPDLVHRSEIIVFTGSNLDIHDAEIRYFYLFPGKKQFVKRMMGRPGDTVFFYGGKLYGLDKAGKDISPLLQRKSLSEIYAVPVLSFDGRIGLYEPFQSKQGPAYSMAILHQMNEPVARLTALGDNRFEGEMVFNSRIHNRNFPYPKNFYELWGIGNYGIARITTKEAIKGHASGHGMTLGDEKLYMEIQHHPNINHLELTHDFHGRLRPQFSLSTSIIPLDDAHLKKIFNGLYTARFVVKNGFATLYRMKKIPYGANHYLVRLKGVPDGTYEFFAGQGYRVLSPPKPIWGGITKKLPPSHPLMTYSHELTQKLFNYGIDFNKRLVVGPRYETERFAFFRDGDLYFANTPIFRKGEPVLDSFITEEKQRAGGENGAKSYQAFIDSGAPLLENGDLDKDFILQYGLKLPSESYLALGDNYAMSADSRDFGFVPECNLKGSPVFLFWPIGSRFGWPNQPWFSALTIPNVILWIIALLCLALWYWTYKKNHSLPLKFDK